MLRKSLWVPLALAVAMVCVVTIIATPIASASPAQAVVHHAALHQTTQQRATHRNAASVIPGCPSGEHLLVELGIFGPSVFGNYHSACISSKCSVSSSGTVTLVCLYQDANYGGQEIDFFGSGCANLTDFAGPGSNGTWNDAMSSFQIQSGTNTYGAFWWDTYDNSYYYLFGPPGSGRVSATSYIGNTWNDQASSLQLDPNPGGC